MLYLSNGKPMIHKFRSFIPLITALLIAPPSFGQAKWWWDKYPTSTDKTIELKNAVGGSVSAVQNPTGASASVKSNAATQPPTVIIQQTASVGASNGTGMTCTQPSFGVGTSSGYGAYYYSMTCPTITGYSVHPIMATPNFSYGTQNVVASCCYVKSAESTSSVSSGAYDPWGANGIGGGGAGTASFKTPGSATWTVPTGVYRIWLSMSGAGGGGAAGGAGGTANTGGGGGSGGMTYRHPISVFPGDTVSMVIGSGGSGGSNSSGQPGGMTTVVVTGTTYSAGGGGGGSMLNMCGGGGHSTGTLSEGGFGGTNYCSWGHSQPSLTSVGGQTNGAIGGSSNQYGYYTYFSPGCCYSNTNLGTPSNPNPAPLPPQNAVYLSIGGTGAWGYLYSNGGPGFMGIRSDPSTATSRGADGASANATSFVGLGGKGIGGGGGGGTSGPGGRGADGGVWIEW